MNTCLERLLLLGLHDAECVSWFNFDMDMVAGGGKRVSERCMGFEMNGIQLMIGRIKSVFVERGIFLITSETF